MSSNSQNDAGKKWLDDPPSSWGECPSHPPLASAGPEELTVVEQRNATVFQIREGATRWVKVDNGSLLEPEDYR